MAGGYPYIPPKPGQPPPPPPDTCADEKPVEGLPTSADHDAVAEEQQAVQDTAAQEVPFVPGVFGA